MALAAHLADIEPEALLQGYVVAASYTTLEMHDRDEAGYLTVRPNGQEYHSTVGLLHVTLDDFTGKGRTNGD